MISFLIGASVFVGGLIASVAYLGTNVAGLLGVIVAVFVGYSIAK
jgi:hypothetical protein